MALGSIHGISRRNDIGLELFPSFVKVLTERALDEMAHSRLDAASLGKNVGMLTLLLDTHEIVEALWVYITRLLLRSTRQVDILAIKRAFLRRL